MRIVISGKIKTGTETHNVLVQGDAGRYDSGELVSTYTDAVKAIRERLNIKEEAVTNG